MHRREWVHERRAHLAEAVRGARQFVGEAVAAHYKVGVMLWDTAGGRSCEPTLTGRRRRWCSATRASGAQRPHRPLDRCHEILDRFTGDRVVALFGDGDLATQGAGARQGSADEVGQHPVRDPWPRRRHAPGSSARSRRSNRHSAAIDDVADLAKGIAGMAASLKRRGFAR